MDGLANLLYGEAMVFWFKQAPGPLLVFLHGFTGDVHAWDDVVAHLPDTQAAAALYLPGHHPNAAPAADFEQTCDGIARQLEDLSSASVHLVGYSLGARLALGIAVRHPKLLARVSLVGGHIGLELPQERRDRQTVDERWAKVLDEQGIVAFVDAWESQAIFASQQTLCAAKRQQQRERRLHHDPRALSASLRSTGLAVMPNYWPSLGHVAVPTNLVVGSCDQKFLGIAERAQILLSHGCVHSIAGCGHNPLLENPAALADLLEHRRPDD